MHLGVAVVVSFNLQLARQFPQVLLSPLVPHVEQAEVEHIGQNLVTDTAVTLLGLPFVFILLLGLQPAEFIQFRMHFLDMVLQLFLEFSLVSQQQHVQKRTRVQFQMLVVHGVVIYV